MYKLERIAGRMYCGLSKWMLYPFGTNTVMCNLAPVSAHVKGHWLHLRTDKSCHQLQDDTKEAIRKTDDSADMSVFFTAQ